MKKVMISQPMANKTNEEIEKTRDDASRYLTSEGYIIVDTLFTDEWYSKESMEERGVVSIPLCFLSKSLESMANCNTVYFCTGWENARGCIIEHEAAQRYGIEILYEENLKDAN